MNRVMFTAMVLLVVGCQTAMRQTKPPPLEETREGQVVLYLQATDRPDAPTLTFSAVSAVDADGVIYPLQLALSDAGPQPGRRRMLASGRARPGSYVALLVKLSRATVSRDGKTTDMLVSVEPARIPVSFALAHGQAVVLQVSAREGSPEQGGFAAPELGAAVSRRPLPVLSGFAPDAGADQVAVFDRRSREVLEVFPTGRDPVAVAADPRALRLFVALRGDDVVQILDLSSGAPLLRGRLQPGDHPQDLALTPDMRTLIVVNRGSNTASFVDASAGIETARVPIGMGVTSLVLDRAGRRAYAFNRGSSTLTVIDVANRSVVRTVSTEPEPIRGQFNRAGDRLYVAAVASPYLSVFSVPDMAVVKRIWVGLGAVAVEVDPVTDLVYVAKRDDPVLQGYDPYSYLAVDAISLPAPTVQMAIDEVERTLFAASPDANLVSVVDLGSRRVVAEMEVGEGPTQVVLVGARR